MSFQVGRTELSGDAAKGSRKLNLRAGYEYIAEEKGIRTEIIISFGGEKSHGCEEVGGEGGHSQDKKRTRLHGFLGDDCGLWRR